MNYRILRRHGHVSITALLISLAIALFILGALLTTSAQVQESYRKHQQGIVSLKQQRDFLSTFLHQQISQTGYRNLPANTAMPDISVSFPDAYLSGINGDTDQLTFRFEGDGSFLRDCTGLLVPQGTVSENTFAIENNALTCNSTVLLSNVENLQVLYGEDTDLDKTPNHYVPANYPGLAFNRVIAIKMALLIRSAEFALDSATDRNFTLFEVQNTRSDNFLYQVLKLTIPIRNLQS